MALVTSLIIFFANIGKATEKGPESRGEVIAPYSTLGVTSQDHFFLSPVTSNGIWTFISKMDASKSSGPYSVPNYISEPLAFLVNDSFPSGNFREK